MLFINSCHYADKETIMIDWIMENKVWEWFFSGIGVVFLVWLINRFMGGKKAKEVPASIQKSVGKKGVLVEGSVGGDIITGDQGDNININAGGDVTFAKDQGKAYNIKDSQVGVVGDNAKVTGGINFNKNNETGKK